MILSENSDKEKQYLIIDDSESEATPTVVKNTKRRKENVIV